MPLVFGISSGGGWPHISCFNQGVYTVIWCNMYSLHLYIGWNMWEPFPSRWKIFFPGPAIYVLDALGVLAFPGADLLLPYSYFPRSIPQQDWLIWKIHGFLNALNGLQMSIVFLNCCHWQSTIPFFFGKPLTSGQPPWPRHLLFMMDQVWHRFPELGMCGARQRTIAHISVAVNGVPSIFLLHAGGMVVYREVGTFQTSSKHVNIYWTHSENNIRLLKQ